MKYKALSGYNEKTEATTYSAIRYEINKVICVGFRVPSYSNDGFISIVITDKLYDVFMNISEPEYEYQKELFACADEVRNSFNIGAPSGYNIKRFLAGRPAINAKKTSFVKGQMIITVPLPCEYLYYTELKKLDITGHYVNLEVDFLRSTLNGHVIGIDTVIADKITDIGEVKACVPQEPIDGTVLVDYLKVNYYEERIIKTSVLDILNVLLCYVLREETNKELKRDNSISTLQCYKKAFDLFVDNLGAYICEIGEGYKRRFTGSDANIKEMTYILNKLQNDFGKKDDCSYLESYLKESWNAAMEDFRTDDLISWNLYVSNEEVNLLKTIFERVDNYYVSLIASDDGIVRGDYSLADSVLSAWMQHFEYLRSCCLRKTNWSEIIIEALISVYFSKDDVESRAFDFSKDVMFIQSLYDVITKVYKDSGCFVNLEKMSKDIRKDADEIGVRAPYLYQTTYHRFIRNLNEYIDNCVSIFEELADYWNENKYHGIDTVQVILAFVDVLFPEAKSAFTKQLSDYYDIQDFDLSLADKITEFKDAAETIFAQ